MFVSLLPRPAQSGNNARDRRHPGGQTWREARGDKERGEGGSETEKLWENILYFRSARISRRFSLPVELLNQGISW